jgi:AcrR family transcriptional regulator
MSTRRKPQISSRKQPKQTRSAALVTAILDAAIQVLAKEGAHRFTTARVAEKAGVSVGSLYQYFPNKAAILFRLQSDEWRETTQLLQHILQDRTRPPMARLRALVHAFIRSECDEAAVRVALDDAAPLYRSAPEAREAKASGDRTMQLFIREVLPLSPKGEQARAGELIKITLSTVGKQFSETPRSAAEISAFADSLADMLCAYLESLQQPLTPRNATSRHGRPSNKPRGLTTRQC